MRQKGQFSFVLALWSCLCAFETKENLNTDSTAIPAIDAIHMLGCFEIDCKLFIESD